MKKLFVRKVMKRFFDKKEEDRDQAELDDFFGLSDDDTKFAELFAGGTRNRFVSQFSYIKNNYICRVEFVN